MLPATWDKYIINCRGKSLDLRRPQVMGIINLDPASYCKVGRFAQIDEILKHAHEAVAAGAAILDIGAEATNPFTATRMTAQEEMDRLLPVLEILLREIAIPIAVDTYKTEVMKAAIELGVHMINDIMALRSPGAMELLATYPEIPVCLMHMAYSVDENKGNTEVVYPKGLTQTIYNFLTERVKKCVEGGINRHRLLIDPGIGGGNFGKTAQEVLQLISDLTIFESISCPLLLGLSRKSFIGELLNLPVEQRLPASLAMTTLSVERGALLIRAHDVKPTVETLQIVTALFEAQQEKN